MILLAKPKTVITCITLVTLIFAVLAVPTLQKDASPNLLARSHESRVNTDAYRAAFTGSKEMALVLIETQKGIFNKDTLNRVARLTTAFEGISVLTNSELAALSSQLALSHPKLSQTVSELSEHDIDSQSIHLISNVIREIKESLNSDEKIRKSIATIESHIYPIIEVNSITSLDNITSKNGDLIIEPAYASNTDLTKDLSAVKAAITGNKLFHNVLFEDSEKYTGIFIELAIDDDDTPALNRMYAEIQRIIDSEKGQGAVFIAGFPITSATWEQVMSSDIETLLPAVLLLIILFLFICFRTARGILIPLFIAILSIILTVSLQALVGVPINFISNILPVFLIAIGVADGIHIISDYQERLTPNKRSADAVTETMQHLIRPIVMTSITTAIGFWSLSFTELWQIRDFGLFVGVGVIAAMFYSIVLIPPVLVLLPEVKNKSNTLFNTSIQVLIEKSSHVVRNNPATIIITTVLICAASIFSALSIIVENDSVSYFEPELPLVVSTEKFEKNFGGSFPLNIVITLENQQNSFKDPEILKKIQNFQAKIENDSLVGRSFSLADLIQRLNFVMNDYSPEFDRLPLKQEVIDEVNVSGRELISQYILFYEIGGGDLISDVLTDDYRTTHILAVLNTTSSHEASKLIRRISEWSLEYLPDDATISYAGNSVITVAHGDEMVKDLVTSLSISIILITVFLCMIFRSIPMGILAILPLLVTVAINAGLMMLFNVTLNPGTIVVSSIAIGIGVDYSIHYLSRLRRETKRGHSLSDSIDITSNKVGKAIIVNATTVGLAFLVLRFSGFEPLQNMGLLICSTMFVSMFACLFLMPAMIHLLAGKKVYEVTRLRTVLPS